MHVEDSSLPGYHRPSLGYYILIPIEQIQSTGSDWQQRINRLKQEPFGLIPWDH